jgi:hypothetical protein
LGTSFRLLSTAGATTKPMDGTRPSQCSRMLARTLRTHQLSCREELLWRVCRVVYQQCAAQNPLSRPARLFKLLTVTNQPFSLRTVSWTTRTGGSMKPSFSPEVFGSQSSRLLKKLSFLLKQTQMYW